MYPSRRMNDSVHWFMNDLTSRIVAESGIATDRYHIGKMVFQSFKDDPDFVLQIDGATGESETNRSVLERSIRCAIAFKRRGLQRGDVITLMAPNHIDLAIPFYSALYLGVIVSPIDRTLGVDEIRSNFEVTQPKVIFCQSDRAPDVRLALNGIETDTLIVTFDKGDFCSFPEFLNAHGRKTPVEEEFNPTDFDPEDTIAVLIPTSGTTGLPKSAAATHKNFAISGPYLWNRHFQFPTPTKILLIISPLQWLTAIVPFLISPITRFTRLQTSQALIQSHAYELINTYKKFAPRAELQIGFAMSETTMLVFMGDGSNDGYATVGKPLGLWHYRLIDVQTQEDIYEPNRNGELWLKGPGLVKGYYKNPDATAEAFTKDRWFKTGDLFYRDENYNFFFVDRIKMLLKFMNHQISPVEIESTIRQHPGVLDVAVTGIPDPKRGELPIACIVKRPGHDVGAAEIKELVKEKLTDSKQLRGGVIFLEKIPQTPTTKIDRRKLKEIATQFASDSYSK